MAVLAIEAPEVYGIGVGFRAESLGHSFSPEKIRSLRNSVGFPGDGSRISNSFLLAVISTSLNSLAQDKCVLQAAADSGQAGVVAVYLSQTAEISEGSRIKSDNKIGCEMVVTEVIPGSMPRFRVLTSMYKDSGDLVVQGEALIGMSPISRDGQKAQEILGAFHPGLEDVAQKTETLLRRDPKMIVDETWPLYVTPERIRQFAEGSGDFNPLHLDPEVAARTAFGGIIAHGMLGVVSTVLRIEEGRLFRELHKESGRTVTIASMLLEFKRPVRVYDMTRGSCGVPDEINTRKVDGRLVSSLPFSDCRIDPVKGDIPVIVGSFVINH